MRKMFIIACLALSSLLIAGENYSVGELGEKWDFPSDHLPVGATINGHNIVCWNILNTDYLHWIETNSQGLKDSAIMSENVPVRPDSDLTVREERVIRAVLEMATHPTHPRSVIALEETHQRVFDELKSRLPERFLPVLTFEEDIAHGDLFFYDGSKFEIIDNEAAEYEISRNTWMILTLQDRTTGERYRFVQSHVPGGEKGPIASRELATQVDRTFDPSVITLVMGDQNQPPESFLQDLEEVAGKDQLFHILELPYPTHVNTHQEASWIDNLFLACSPVDTGNSPETFFPEVESAVSACFYLADWQV